MPSDQNTPIQLNAPFPNLDNKYFDGSTGLPWASKAAVLASATVAEEFRGKGLTVLIGKREWWFRDGVTDDKLVPKGNYDVVVLNNVDGSYVLEDEELLQNIVVVPNNGNVVDFKVGLTAGASDLVAGVNLTANKGNAFSVPVYANGNTTIYFSGIAGVSSQVIIKLYKF
jgi:hypothetical protein